MEQKQKTFKISTLGCRTNQYESQAYRNQLLSLGLKEVTEGEEADVCIVNTCTVTESADRSSRHQIRQLAKENTHAKLVVTGCLAESQPELIKNIKGVDIVVSNAEKERLMELVFPDETIPEFAIQTFESHTRAFVKVQDGCNSFCTYCIIPYVRGRSRSRTIPEILKEIQGLISHGYKEVVITGINVGDFDGGKSKEEKPERLSDLIRAVDQLDGLERIRVSSIDPDEVDEDLADAIINGKKTCHSMHIVLQSGSNLVLKKMNRKYTRQIFIKTVDYLKSLDPDFTFTTDIIVGFPGESEQDFEETLEMIRQVKFAKVHMFPYSERQRTRAALFPNKISSEVIKERKYRVLQTAEQAAYELRENFISRKMKILTESMEGTDEICGHTDNFLMVYLPKGTLKPNEFVDVYLKENSALGLKGVAING